MGSRLPPRGPVPSTTPFFPNAALPIDELIRASAGFGNVTSTADGDQIIRHTEPGACLGGVPVLSLRTLGSVKVVGRNEPVVVYQPLDNTYDVTLVRNLATYHDALALFEAG